MLCGTIGLLPRSQLDISYCLVYLQVCICVKVIVSKTCRFYMWDINCLKQFLSILLMKLIMWLLISACTSDKYIFFTNEYMLHGHLFLWYALVLEYCFPTNNMIVMERRSFKASSTELIQSESFKTRFSVSLIERRYWAKINTVYFLNYCV